MSSKTRTIQRWIHIILGLVILCHIYSPFRQYPVFDGFVKWLAVPIVVVSGLLLWKPKIFLNIFRIRRPTKSR